MLSQAVVDGIGLDPSVLRRRKLDLKGKTDPFDAWVWEVGDPDPSGIDVG